jgi:hypothetical protein
LGGVVIALSFCHVVKKNFRGDAGRQSAPNKITTYLSLLDILVIT